MQPESQVLVREFNRRLRAALKDAPNHMRVEATLEVESHVQDVLSRRRGSEPEHEQVAAILSGFGAPERYAAALLSQLPDGVPYTVGSGLKEVLSAGSDLLRGAGRLLLATWRQAVALAGVSTRHTFTGLRWVFSRLAAAAYALRGPAEAARGYAAAGVRYGRSGAAVLGRTGVAALARVRHLGPSLCHLVRGAGRLVRSAVNLADTVLASVGRLVRWALRALAVVAVALLALAALGVAGFASLAPDIAGFLVHAFQAEVDFLLNSFRAQTMAHYSPGNPAAYVQTGTTVLAGALTAGLGLMTLLGLMLWNARRRRGSVLG